MSSFLKIFAGLYKAQAQKLELARYERTHNAIMRRILEPQMALRPEPKPWPRRLFPRFDYAANAMAGLMLLLLGGFVGSGIGAAPHGIEAPPSEMMATMNSPWFSLWQDDNL
ncbi:MAG: hypothetical protein FWF24_06200 [Alphaproteobacteria bacterium]|nr:hypothetical protein [Alphaproteobacteria bacterium]